MRALPVAVMRILMVVFMSRTFWVTRTPDDHIRNTCCIAAIAIQPVCKRDIVEGLTL